MSPSISYTLGTKGQAHVYIGGGDKYLPLVPRNHLLNIMHALSGRTVLSSFSWESQVSLGIKKFESVLRLMWILQTNQDDSGHFFFFFLNPDIVRGIKGTAPHIEGQYLCGSQGVQRPTQKSKLLYSMNQIFFPKWDYLFWYSKMTAPVCAMRMTFLRTFRALNKWAITIDVINSNSWIQTNKKWSKEHFYLTKTMNYEINSITHNAITNTVSLSLNPSLLSPPHALWHISLRQQSSGVYKRLKKQWLNAFWV